MKASKILALLAFTWVGTFGFILFMHAYVPPVLRGWISFAILMWIAFELLREWERRLRERIRIRHALTIAGFVQE